MVPTEVRDRATQNLRDGHEVFLTILQIFFASNLDMVDFSRPGSSFNQRLIYSKLQIHIPLKHGGMTFHFTLSGSHVQPRSPEHWVHSPAPRYNQRFMLSGFSICGYTQFTARWRIIKEIRVVVPITSMDIENWSNSERDLFSVSLWCCHQGF